METATTATTKEVRIVCTRPRKEVKIQAEPSDSASDILQKAGFSVNDYYLIKPGDAGDYAPTDLPFDDLPSGGKLHVMPQSDVGHDN